MQIGEKSIRTAGDLHLEVKEKHDKIEELILDRNRLQGENERLKMSNKEMSRQLSLLHSYLPATRTECEEAETKVEVGVLQRLKELLANNSDYRNIICSFVDKSIIDVRELGSDGDVDLRNICLDLIVSMYKHSEGANDHGPHFRRARCKLPLSAYFNPDA